MASEDRPRVASMHAMNTAAAIEQVLSLGKKSSTYKLGLLRALVDFVIEQPAQEPRNGFHRIPAIELARRVLGLYWRPVRLGIQQGTQGTEKIPATIDELAASGVAVPGVELASERSGLPLMNWIETTEAIPPAIVHALIEVRGVLLGQPIQYLHNVPGGEVGIFSLLMQGLPASADYEASRKAAMTAGARPRGSSWAELLASEPADLVLSARSYEEITEVRFWLRDSINIRWARECEGYRGAPVPLEAFEFGEPARDSLIVQSVKRLYTSIGLKTCLYSDQPLPPSWDLDHLLPWSRFPVDLFWNLVPAHPDMNRGKGGKFDLLPRLAEVRPAYEKFLGRVLASNDKLVVKHLRITWRRYFQVQLGESEAEAAAERIWSVVESSWHRLAKAGVRVWQAGEAA